MRPRHWKEARAIFLITMKHVNPYLEDNDLELLSMGRESCVYRFWTHRIMKGALLAIKQLDDVFDSEENMKILSKSFEPFSKDKVRSGMLFYEKLFDTHPAVIPYFGRTDMDFLAGHLFDAVELLSKVFNSFEKATPVLQQLGKIHDLAKIPVFTYGAIGEVLDAGKYISTLLLYDALCSASEDYCYRSTLSHLLFVRNIYIMVNQY